MMSESNSNQEENIIVKKIEGPSVDEEYQVITTEDNSYYVEEEPQQTNKMKVVLPMIALLVGGGAFYLTQNKEKVEKHENLVIPKVETTTKTIEETTPPITKQPIEEKVLTQKEEKEPLVIVKKVEEPKEAPTHTMPTTVVEKEAPTHYVEALAMPTVIEKENKVEKVDNKVDKVNKIDIVSKPKVEEIIYEEVITPKPKEKKVLIKKRTPSFVIHYEKIEPKIIHVRKGDTLLILAKRFYGNEMEYKRIIRANRRIKSEKTALHVGEKLIIPRKDNKRRRRYIIVEKGNTLALIAKKFYGDERAVSRIVRANYKIKSSRSLLRLGQKVYVPR